MTKREFLASCLGAGLAFAQPPAAKRVRVAKTSKLFRSPGPYPNSMAAAPQGVWIAEQKMAGEQAVQYHLPEPATLTEEAWLVDWNGKVLKKVTTPSRNTSGMAYGDGRLWMCANAPPQGVFEVDMNSRLVSHRQIPLGPASDGGGCHGAFWNEGKLWVASLRLRGILRIDPKTWTPEFLIPVYEAPGKNRYHGIAWDNGAIWQVTGNESKNYAEGRPGLVKYDAATGKVLETVEFAAGSADPHALVMHEGALISCDAGIHPGWPNNDSPTTGWIFRIDLT